MVFSVDVSQSHLLVLVLSSLITTLRNVSYSPSNPKENETREGIRSLFITVRERLKREIYEKFRQEEET